MLYWAFIRICWVGLAVDTALKGHFLIDMVVIKGMMTKWLGRIGFEVYRSIAGSTLPTECTRKTHLFTVGSSFLIR